ncbi:MAG TPA: prolyl oligopeptidase family serine peptidase, partial [Pseudogracilibacillus sp.]|nr:prolyl oligopeptidase family serine peptidase [Pseudogracilibacillus sp.]
NYTFQEASALEQVKKNTLPILYFTGEADTFVPTEMTHELYDATTSEREIVTFPHANHGEGFVLYRVEYKMAVHDFLDRFVE